MTYKIVEFDKATQFPNIQVEELREFIADAEIIITRFEMAYSKDLVSEVRDSFRGAIIEFKDGGFTYGYNIESKLIKSEQ